MKSVKEIKEMLKNYRSVDIKVGILERAGKKTTEMQEHQLLTECVECLDDEGKDIIKRIYFIGLSQRDYAKRNYTSHTTIQRKEEKLFKIITECYNYSNKK
ncbi:MAG: hypothetical protein WCR54_08705 [Clostridia bacterium]